MAAAQTLLLALRLMAKSSGLLPLGMGTKVDYGHACQCYMKSFLKAKINK
jgi:hypothetical protein